MTREKLIRLITDTPKPFSVSPIKQIYAEKELMEYEQQIRTDAIEECIEIANQWKQYPLAKKLEQLKEQNEQNSITEALKPRGCADMPKEIVCNCTKEQR